MSQYYITSCGVIAFQLIKTKIFIKEYEYD